MFSTEGDPVGIQVGTAIATLVRKADHAPAKAVGFRHLWGQSKRADLLASAEADPAALYDSIAPSLPLGLPFVRTVVSEDWFDWPALPDLFPASFPGVQTKRDSFLVDIDLDRLKKRIGDYFNPTLSHGEIARRHPDAMKSSSGFVVHNARKVRDTLIARGSPDESGFVRHTYRPFDDRWLYWKAGDGLLGRPVPEYKPHVFRGNVWFSFNQRPQKGAVEPRACVTDRIACHDLIGNSTCFFSAWLRDDGEDTGRRANITATARRYLDRLGLDVEDLFHHVLATLHDPAYRQANAGALSMEWPRIPLPGWPDGESDDTAATLARSAERGRALAALLDPEAPVPGVTTGTLRPQAAAIAVPATTSGRNMTGDDFALTAGWGHLGTGGAVMPGQGRATERPYTPEERAALAATLPTLGNTTFDIHLNANAFWRNVPANVWRYKLGDYQVLKKWLSYRERPLLARPLTPEEVQHFTDTARRIAAILLVSA